MLPMKSPVSSVWINYLCFILSGQIWHLGSDMNIRVLPKVVDSYNALSLGNIQSPLPSSLVACNMSGHVYTRQPINPAYSRRINESKYKLSSWLSEIVNNNMVKTIFIEITTTEKRMNATVDNCCQVWVRRRWRTTDGCWFLFGSLNMIWIGIVPSCFIAAHGRGRDYK